VGFEDVFKKQVTDNIKDKFSAYTKLIDDKGAEFTGDAMINKINEHHDSSKISSMFYSSMFYKDYLLQLKDQLKDKKFG
jgi:hypothetical protein